MNQTCPVCYTNIIQPPHGVCAVCLEKHKKMYIHGREAGEKWIQPLLDAEILKPEFFENAILSHMNHEEEEWEEVSKDGLSAVQVILDILDDVDVNNNWHKRRITFMRDMVERLDTGYFAPATREQVTDFANAAVDFWSGRITKQETKPIYENMRTLLDKKDVTSWDSNSFLLWMMEEEDNFDWMWEQWFDCIRSCIPDTHNDNIWLELLQKHFSEEIRAWVEKGSDHV